MEKAMKCFPREEYSLADPQAQVVRLLEDFRLHSRRQ